MIMKKEDYKFYNSWKNKTPLEIKYIEALEKALQWIKSQPFLKDINAIYIKGSFVFREINEKSDIDLVPICRDNKSMIEIKQIRDLHKSELKPVDILPMSLEELKANENYVLEGAKPGFKGRPDLFIHFLPYHELVYGKPLNTKGLKIRTIEKILSNTTSSMKNKFIPMYEKKEIGFSQLLKQAMHIIYWEERVKGHVFPPSWQGIKKACPNNALLKHILSYRKNPTKDEKIRTEFIKEIKEYFKIN